jgi:hypothetical protein
MSIFDDDEPTLGEQMNRGLGLDPGFTAEHTGLAGALSDDIDDTTVRAQAAVDKRRKEELAAERAQAAADRIARSADKP